MMRSGSLENWCGLGVDCGKGREQGTGNRNSGPLCHGQGGLFFCAQAREEVSMMVTLLRAKAASVAATEPLTSMARQASRMTVAANPQRRASRAEKPTQKS